MDKRVPSAMDVAKEANVSQSTVSRVFTPGAKVSEKTKKKVRQAAEELNYQPNALARGLITNKTQMVGLAMKEIQNPFYHEVLGVFTKKLRARGYSVLFVYTESEEIQQEEINHFLEYNVEGIVVLDALLSSKLVSTLQDNQIPVTLFNRYDTHIDCHSVCCHNMDASKEIATYMADAGCKDIVFITGKVDTSTSRDRQQGFTAALNKRGLSAKIVEGDYTYETAYHLTAEMMEAGHQPDAILGANDITALGALDALKMNHRSVPTQTMVVGFDNITMASWPGNQLSTWAQPVEEMIDQSIQLLLTDKAESKRLFLHGRFIHRQTTRN